MPRARGFSYVRYTHCSRPNNNVMAEYPLVIHTLVHELTKGDRLGFTFHYGGRQCYCFDATGTDAFSTVKPGDGVTISGRWNTAIVDVVEVEKLEPRGTPGAAVAPG
jgi:hypothetical protein